MKILTCKQVAELIQAKPSTIYAWAEQSLIPSFKVNGLLRVDEDEVLAWLTRCKEGRYSWYNGSIPTRSSRIGGRKQHGAL
jgi:excisionase family DNA binding protein